MTNPHFMVQLTRAGSAPRKPGRAALVQLFQTAWNLVPPTRRPDLNGVLRVSVDVHLIYDDAMAALNERFMCQRGPTDVLSFAMGEFDPECKACNLGEVVVSFQTAEREARARGIPIEEELARYCVHGFLHLLGYEDDTPARRRAMFKVQEKAVKAVSGF